VCQDFAIGPESRTAAPRMNWGRKVSSGGRQMSNRSRSERQGCSVANLVSYELSCTSLLYCQCRLLLSLFRVRNGFYISSHKAVCASNPIYDLCTLSKFQGTHDLIIKKNLIFCCPGNLFETANALRPAYEQHQQTEADVGAHLRK